MEVLYNVIDITKDIKLDSAPNYQYMQILVLNGKK